MKESLRNRAVLMLYTISLAIDILARGLAGEENFNTEYHVNFLGMMGGFARGGGRK